MLIKFLFIEIKYDLCNNANTFENKTFQTYCRELFFIYFLLDILKVKINIEELNL